MKAPNIWFQVLAFPFRLVGLKNWGHVPTVLQIEARSMGVFTKKPAGLSYIMTGTC